MFKDALVQAYRDSCQTKAAIQAEKAAELQERAISTLYKWMADLEVTGVISAKGTNTLIVTADDLYLYYTADYDTGQIGFSLQGICPHCNVSCWSVYCYDPISLGGQIVNFLPGRNHDCSSSYYETQTWRDKLVDAIEEAILAISGG